MLRGVELYTGTDLTSSVPSAIIYMLTAPIRIKIRRLNKGRPKNFGREGRAAMVDNFFIGIAASLVGSAIWTAIQKLWRGLR